MWDRHFKFYESRDILGADQGRSTNMREIIWHQADPRKVPAVATTWFTERRNAAEPSKSSSAASALAGGPLD